MEAVLGVKLLCAALMTEPRLSPAELSSRRTEPDSPPRKKTCLKDKSLFLVAQVRSNWNEVLIELARWNMSSTEFNLSVNSLEF